MVEILGSIFCSERIGIYTVIACYNCTGFLYTWYQDWQGDQERCWRSVFGTVSCMFLQTFIQYCCKILNNDIKLYKGDIDRLQKRTKINLGLNHFASQTSTHVDDWSLLVHQFSSFHAPPALQQNHAFMAAAASVWNNPLDSVRASRSQPVFCGRLNSEPLQNTVTDVC